MTDPNSIETLTAAISPDRLIRTAAAMVEVAAPTGYERACAERIRDLLTGVGVTAELVVHDDRAASVVGRIPARGAIGGASPTIMLYSPIDTVTTGDPADDAPQAADAITGHLLPNATISADGRLLSGLGAMNPKGHAACILEVAAVLAATKVEPAGEVIVAFGAGGMPTFAIDNDDRTDTGHGVGATAILDHLRATGSTPDAAIVAKSGWFVQYEEVGLAWTDITVRGEHTYVGAKHRLPYRNAVADAARVTLALEKHFAATAGQRTTDTLEPQAMVASLHGGWNRMAAFTPASATVRVDQRLLPGETGAEANRRIVDVLAELIAIDPGLDATAELVVDIRGSHTDRDHWICAAGRAAWEAIEGRPHTPPERQSGSTDANIIRNAGIPTMRVGLPKVHVDGVELGFGEGMNTVDAASMTTLTELLLRSVMAGQTAETDQEHQISHEEASR